MELQKQKTQIVAKEEQLELRPIVQTLHDMMQDVTKKKCTAENVQAACACAGKIIDFLNFNLEVKRFQHNIDKGR